MKNTLLGDHVTIKIDYLELGHGMWSEQRLIFDNLIVIEMHKTYSKKGEFCTNHHSNSHEIFAK